MTSVIGTERKIHPGSGRQRGGKREREGEKEGVKSFRKQKENETAEEKEKEHFFGAGVSHIRLTVLRQEDVTSPPSWDRFMKHPRVRFYLLVG